MDRIPVFNGEYEQISTSLTCGQFLNMIENVAVEQKLTDLQILELCLSKVSGKVLDYWLNLDSDSVDRKSWTLQKNTLMTEFGTKLGIKEKVEIRKNLQQNQTESVEDFYDRCVHAQYLVSNDVRDETFDREVLLHFLVGLLPSIRDLVLSQAYCHNTPQDYIQEAKKHFQKIIVKNEPVDAFDDDVKMEDGSSLYDDYELLEDVKSEERFYENHDYDSFEPNIQLDELPLLDGGHTTSAGQKIKKNVQAKILVKSNKSKFFCEIPFLAVLNFFLSSKNDFCPFLKLQKMEFCANFFS